MIPPDRPDDAAADPPGASATPLDDIERARWNAVADAASQLAGALVRGDEEGAAAASAQMRQVPIDPDRVLNAVHVPDDAGEWADGLERIVRRIPDRWGRWIRVERGWYPIVVALDEYLVSVDPGYVVLQVKEKFGSLDYYFETSPLPCCQRFLDEAPSPDSSEWERWEAEHQQHVGSAEHEQALADDAEKQALMDAAVSRATVLAAHTCELTGEFGVMTIDRHWWQTLDPVTAPASARLAPPRQLLLRASPSPEALGAALALAQREAHHWYTAACRLRRALLDLQAAQAPADTSLEVDDEQ